VKEMAMETEKETGSEKDLVQVPVSKPDRE
jgi:hypothetical protein